MPATVITLSPNMPLDRAERVVRERVARNRVAEVVAKTADRRQVRHLRRLARRLDADPGLEVYGSDRADGGTYVIVVPAGSGPVGLRGEPKIS